MWSGLLPPGVTESDLSEEEEEGGPGPSGATAGVSETCLTVCGPGISVPRDLLPHKFQALQKRCSELQVESRKKRRRHRKGKKRLLEEQKNNESPAPGTPPALETLQKYFGVNDHLEPPVCMKIMKKSRLEQNLDEALKKGDVDDAEELSDRLATREIAVKITKAAAHHRHMKAKEEPQSSRDAAGKTRPPAWGFEAKKRWETKSNMGYM